MLLKVGRATEIFLRGSDNTNSANWVHVKQFTSSTEACRVTHPNARHLQLYVWWQEGKLFLQNNSGGKLTYKVHDATDDQWTAPTEIQMKTDHYIQTENANIWFLL